MQDSSDYKYSSIVNIDSSMKLDYHQHQNYVERDYFLFHDSNNKIKRPSLNKAVMENTIYNGYRWLFVDRELNPDIIHNIQPTKKTKVQKLGYIAQLNSEQTEITNVYLDRKTAAFYNGHASLDYIVLNNTISNGFYYKLYDKLDDHLKQTFVEKIGEEPILYKNGLGQFDKDNNLIREFVCKYDCIRLLKISDKTLSKALTKNIEYNGFYYKELGSKLKIH
jgi:hypothetical protein